MSGYSWVGPYLLPEPAGDSNNAATMSQIYNQALTLDPASQGQLAFDIIANAQGAQQMNNSQVLRVGGVALVFGAGLGYLVGRMSKKKR